MKTGFKTLVHLIPETVRDHIFDKLDLSSKLAARNVCKRWRQLVDKTFQFRVILTEDSYKFVLNFGKKRSINELIVGYFSKQYPPNGWNLSIKGLTLMANYRYEMFNKGSSEPISLAIVVMPELKLEQLFTEFKNISKLTLSSMAMVDIKRHSFLEHFKFMNLKTIDISVEEDYGLDALKDILLSSYFKKLQGLYLTVNNNDDMTLYQEMFSCIGNYASSVKTLKYDYVRAPLNTKHNDNDNTDSNDNNEGQELINLNRDHTLEPNAYATVLQNLGSLVLESADIYILSSEGRARKNFALHMLQAQKTLTILHLYNLRSDNMPVWRSLQSILSECSNTLKSVVLDGCFCEYLERDPPGPFSGKWMKPCVNLQTLEFMVCGVKITDVTKFPKETINTLFLGHSLESKQIKYILKNFKQLESLSLPQTQGPQAQIGSPQISLANFISAIQLPKLSRLSLSSKTCKYRQIRTYASSLIGVFEDLEDESLPRGVKRGDVKFLIDRTIFMPPNSA